MTDLLHGLGLGAALLLLLVVPSPRAAANDNAGCRLDEAKRATPGRLVQVEPGVWSWRAARGDVVRCDEAGYEPVDVACGAGCVPGAKTLRLHASRTVELRPERDEDAVEVTVEWRRFGGWGEATERLATRTVELPARLAVAVDDDRLLRVRRAGSAPTTLYLAPLDEPIAEEAVADVDLAAGGGEIFGFLEVGEADDSARPVALRWGDVDVPLGDDGLFALSGLRPGTHRFVATVRGEDSGDDLEVVGEPLTVRAGETTERIPWLLPPPTRLEGTVTVANGRPVADLGVLVRRAVEPPSDTPEPVAETMADLAGGYRLVLPGPGRYRVEIRGESPTVDREVTADETTALEGVTPFDLHLGDAFLRVRLERDDGAPRRDDVTVELRAADEDRVLRATLVPAGVDEAILTSLGYGRYDLSASADTGWSTASRTTVALDKSSPVAATRLVLARRDSFARIVDRAGRTLPELLVALDERQVFEDPPGSGLYPLGGAGAGSALRVVPPPTHVPVCRRLAEPGEIEIVLDEAAGDAILIPPKQATPSPGSFLGMLEGLPGSDCPMPTTLLWEPFVDEIGRDRIRLRGMPAGSFTLVGPLGTARIVVPGPPVAFGD